MGAMEAIDVGTESAELWRVCEVSDIYGEGQMSHRSVCMWAAKCKADLQYLEDADCQDVLQQLPQTVT